MFSRVFFSINSGLLFDVVCYDDGLEGSSGDISLSRRIYAHRAIPEVLVQEIKITNPTGSDQVFQLDEFLDNAGLLSKSALTKFGSMYHDEL